MTFRFSCLAVCVLLGSCAALEPAPPVPPPPPAPGDTAAIASLPPFMQEEAWLREWTAQWARNVATAPGFSALWVDNPHPYGARDFKAGNYVVVVAIKGGASRDLQQRLSASANPRLRPHIRFVAAKRDATEVKRDEARIIALLQTMPDLTRSGWGLSHNPRTGLFEIGIENIALKAPILAALPADIQPDVTITEGGVILVNEARRP